MKQQRKPYWNSRTNEWVHMFMCPMNHRCKCQAKVRIMTGKDYKRLEFFGTHDENSHAQACCRPFQNIVVQADCYHSRCGYGRAEAVCRCTTPQSDACKGQSGQTQAHPSVSAAVYPATCSDIPEDFDPAETRLCNRSRILGRTCSVVREARILCRSTQAQRSG